MKKILSSLTLVSMLTLTQSFGVEKQVTPEIVELLKAE